MMALGGNLTHVLSTTLGYPLTRDLNIDMAIKEKGEVEDSRGPHID